MTEAPTMHLAYREQERVHVLTLDRPGSSANILDTAAVRELNALLDCLAADARGLVLLSAKPSIFVAGADVHELAALARGGDLESVIRLGQDTFNRIAALPLVTVAAIHGACLGGGLELALACDYRLATRDRATRIGLPETSLGILPTWGGATRLPRLIGLPAALDLVLAGRILPAPVAAKRGVVDELVPREHLLRFALECIGRGKPARRSFWFNTALPAAFVRDRAAARAAAKTRGHYPAVTEALDAMARGVTKPLPDALALEREAALRLARTPACRNLMGLFALRERAKHLGADDVAALCGRPPAGDRPAPVARVAVIGAGVMGAGIAQWISSRGIAVLLRDVNAEAVNRGMTAIAGLYRDAAKRRILSEVEARRGLGLVAPADADAPLARIDLVIEAAVEQLDVKKEIFRKLEAAAPPHALLATNTSALPITDLAKAVKSPGRVVGLHFFNPVHRMELVEIVVGRATDPDAALRAVRFAQQLGKLPVLARDRPGFIVNRVLMPYLVEAGLLFAAGGDAREIDEAMLDFGMPMGPLRLIDEVGVDVAWHVARELGETYGHRMPAPPLLAAMVQAGLLGRKSGRGFYIHAGKDEPRPNPEAREVAGGATAGTPPRGDLQRRMALLMVNEAARCVEENVVARAEDVDFAMVMGTGFAPFRGGPLQYADDDGLAGTVADLQRLAARDPRFEPAALLQAHASEGTTFRGRDVT